MGDWTLLHLPGDFRKGSGKRFYTRKNSNLIALATAFQNKSYLNIFGTFLVWGKAGIFTIAIIFLKNECNQFCFSFSLCKMLLMCPTICALINILIRRWGKVLPKLNYHVIFKSSFQLSILRNVILRNVLRFYYSITHSFCWKQTGLYTDTQKYTDICDKLFKWIVFFRYLVCRMIHCSAIRNSSTESFKFCPSKFK